MSIKITRDNDQIKVSSPYSPDLPKRARNISGRWNSVASVWVFPAAAEDQVRDLYMDVYGEWDDMPADTVSITCTCDTGASEHTGSLTLGGRVIARAMGRDSGARTADGVIVLTGGFRSGGSVKNWDTVCQDDTTFRVLNVPRVKAEALVDYPEWCDTIVIDEAVSVPAEQGNDRDSLIAERTRLAARIAEIDAILHQE